MTDYRKLALRYLKLGKRRSIVTGIGVMITVIVIYAALNYGYSYILHQRQEVRKTADYEIVFLSDDTEKLSQVAADDRMVRAYTGRYVVEEDVFADEEQTADTRIYDNALYVNIRHPYRMYSVMEKMKADYGVDAELNWELSSLYIQDTDGLQAVALLVILLITYIFAIFAVGMLRNAIKMFVLEQIKDYGILRCIGATKGQLHQIIYCMGAIIEIAGIAAGVLAGTGVSMLLGFAVGIDAGFHIQPVIPILIAYLGDLYFVMQECSKLVITISPVSAVRGEYRIKKEKIRVRGNGLMGRLFGIEGAYARKSVLRNSGRFAKTVFTVMISITACIICLSSWDMIHATIRNTSEMYGRYMAEDGTAASIYYDVEKIQGNENLSADTIKDTASRYYITEAKLIYRITDNLVDPEEYYGKLDPDYKEQTNYGNYLGQRLQEWRDRDKTEYRADDDVEYKKAFSSQQCSMVGIEGCDQNDLDELARFVKSGTAELSEDGILVVNGGSTLDYAWSGDERLTLYDPAKHFKSYDFQLGDKIRLIDYKEYNKRYHAAYEQMVAESIVLRPEISTDSEYQSEVRGTKEGRKTYYEQYVIAEQIRQELIEEGRYRTYTVQGILDFGDQLMPNEGCIYMKRDAFFDLSGYDEQDVTGVKYAIDLNLIPAEAFNELNLKNVADDVTDVVYGVLYVRNMIRYVLAFVIFAFALSSVNIINSIEGSIHMRRKEFAQLRVIGMSRKRLIHTVMLEGVMTTVISNLLGFLFGTIFTIYLYVYISMVLYVKPTVSWWAFGVGLIVSAFVICGSIYVPLRELPKDIVDDLKLEE